MKIVVAVKQVPERDAAVRVSADGRSVDGWSVDESDVSWTMNEPDAYALEEALQLRERAAAAGASDSEVVVVCAGPERVGTTLREALAKGADRAIHVMVSDLGKRDSLGVARLLADAVRGEAADLVLTGLQSDDLGAGQTGVVMAELLGVPHGTLVLRVELVAGGLRVKRELEDGWFQHVEMGMPALLTVQSGGNKLRYATLMGIKKARGREIRVVEAGAAEARVDEVVRVSAPVREKRTEMLVGTAEEIAAGIVERLKGVGF